MVFLQNVEAMVMATVKATVMAMVMVMATVMAMEMNIMKINKEKIFDGS